MNEIETLVAKLQLLAAKPNLSSAENAEAQAAMQSLKAMGMSNDEIAKICKGRWAVSTIKGYTPGIIAPSHSPWQDVISALTDLISTNLSLDGVIAVIAVIHTLSANKLTLEEVIEFLKTVAGSGLNAAQVINEVKALQQSGLSIKAAVGVTAIKDKMESCGLTLEALPALAKIAQQYNDLQQVLETFSVYPSLTALQVEITAAQKELENSQAAQTSASKQLEQTEAKNQQLLVPIKAYETILEFGFNEKVLIALSDMTSNYGGPKPVIQAVKKYASLEEIKGELSSAKSELASYQSMTSQLITKHGYLTTAIKMCETLITNHQFGLDAIGTILEVAKKFGEPVAVLKALEVYGQIKALETRVYEMEGAITEREKLLAILEAQFKEAQEKLEGLYAVVLHIADKKGQLEGEFKGSENLQKLLAIINDPEKASYADHGQLVSMLAVSLRKWVTVNETKFKWSVNNIKTGLKGLVEELGGIA